MDFSASHFEKPARAGFEFDPFDILIEADVHPTETYVLQAENCYATNAVTGTDQIMADSGFTWMSVIGESHLKTCVSKPIQTRSRPIAYTFGAGEPVHTCKFTEILIDDKYHVFTLLTFT